MSGRRYKAEDLRVGMIVSRYELADVYDLYVLLGDYNQKTQSGRIIHLCKREDRATDEEFSKIAKRDGVILILSILVYTLFSRMFDLMQPPVVKHSIAVA